MLLRSNRNVLDVSIDTTGETDEPSNMPEIPDASPNPEHRYSERERGQLLFVAINRLKPEMRIAIRLKVGKQVFPDRRKHECRHARSRRVQRERVDQIRLPSDAQVSLPNQSSPPAFGPWPASGGSARFIDTEEN